MVAVRVDAVGLVVEDLKRSMDFYARLGVEWPADWEPPHVQADLGGVLLMLDTLESIQELGLHQDGVGAREGVALAAVLESPADVDTLYAELAAEGHGRTPPWDAPWGMRYATLADPDGTQVDLHAWLPGYEPSS